MSTMSGLTWPLLSDGSPRLVVVPVGATEQHGPHLPLTTDTEIASGLAQRLAAAVAGVVAAPALPYGSSGEHQGFAGTISIGAEATCRLLVELGRSAHETFERVLFICAHGGNARPMGEAVQCLRSEGRDVRAWSPRWSGDAHAGRLETSLMLAIAPERVQLARAQPGNPAPLAQLMPALVSRGVHAVSPTGVLGDPTGASAHEGRQLLEAETARLAHMVASWCSDG